MARLPAHQNKYNRRQNRTSHRDMLEEELEAEEAMEYLEHKRYENNKNHYPPIDKHAHEKEMYWLGVESQQEHWHPGEWKKKPKPKKKKLADHSEWDRLHELLEAREAKLQSLLTIMSQTNEWPLIAGLGVECEALSDEIDDLRNKLFQLSAEGEYRKKIEQQERKIEQELSRTKSHKKKRQLRKTYAAWKTEEKKIFRDKKIKPKSQVKAGDFEVDGTPHAQTKGEQKKIAKRSNLAYRKSRTPTPLDPEKRNKKMKHRTPITRVRGGLDTREWGQRQSKLLRAEKQNKKIKQRTPITREWGQRQSKLLRARKGRI